MYIYARDGYEPRDPRITPRNPFISSCFSTAQFVFSVTCPRHGRAQQQQRPGYIAAQSAWQRARYRPTHLSAWLKTTGNGYFRKKIFF